MNIAPSALPLAVLNVILELAEEFEPEMFEAHDPDGRVVVMYRHTTDEGPPPLEGWESWYDRVPPVVAEAP